MLTLTNINAPKRLAHGSYQVTLTVGGLDGILTASALHIWGAMVKEYDHANKARVSLTVLPECYDGGACDDSNGGLVCDICAGAK